jgi:hypothetical protein
MKGLLSRMLNLSRARKYKAVPTRTPQLQRKLLPQITFVENPAPAPAAQADSVAH